MKHRINSKCLFGRHVGTVTRELNACLDDAQDWAVVLYADGSGRLVRNNSAGGADLVFSFQNAGELWDWLYADGETRARMSRTVRSFPDLIDRLLTPEKGPVQ